jgi:hypothetical protein
MDRSRESSSDEPGRPAAPFVVVFFRHGDRLCARIRDVQTQEQWIVHEAQPLQALLMKPAPE